MTFVFENSLKVLNSSLRLEGLPIRLTNACISLLEFHTEPATIIPGVNVTKGEVGRPAELPCDARGWPKPTVTWWRETTMLPLSSRRYEQLPNYALLIRSVEYEDAGDYSCNAHNGIGSGATYKVTLIIDLAAVPSRGDEHDTNFRDSEPEPPPFNSWDNGNSY